MCDSSVAVSELNAHVVVVKAGPVYDLNDNVAFHASNLSRVATVELHTSGPSVAEAAGDRYRVYRDALPDDASAFVKARYVLRTAARISESVRRVGKPVIIVTYDPFLTGMIGLLVKWRSKVKLICEVNGVYGDDENLIDMPRWRRPLKKSLMLGVGSFVLRRADGIRLLFDGQLSGFRLGGTRPIIRGYFDPVPIDRFHDLGEGRDVLLVGFPFRRKGVDIAIKAFAMVRDRHPEWTLTLIGYGLAPHLDSVGVSLERVRAIPPMKNEEIAKWIGRCGILFMPSRSEAMGRVLIEAAAAGKARLASRVDGIPTVIEDGVDGLLASKNDVDAFAAKLDELLSSRELRARLGSAAKTRAHRDFSPNRHLEHFVEHASAVLGAVTHEAKSGNQ
jgi:glycosyltransferase involved in cell wall biosynthesis